MPPAMPSGPFTSTQWAFLESHHVARLATVGTDGEPHVVPICYALGDQCLYTPIDEKPKRVEGRQLRRVRNIEANPRVAVVVDHYADDWTELGYVLVQGRAEIIGGGPEHAEALSLLRARYPQYRSMDLESRLVIKITPTRVVGWGNDV
jgi:PPOX class probable F420-dependent enzyme